MTHSQKIGQFDFITKIRDTYDFGHGSIYDNIHFCEHFLIFCPAFGFAITNLQLKVYRQHKSYFIIIIIILILMVSMIRLGNSNKMCG
ncbi:uncharacterized protein OCT59_009132 [Rhizophagus irregularis]|uniref:uncharacterized protein n=1 Tax=Rhizophagus irregularis TaxID=588596 RepID=UPI0019E7B86A|nr:hypothetical protein OCT59_009132 [Rhizophagus irregularis]GET59313.1 hypothetical protein RIR_jg854.t2 [Rhizophagus irregularis DAOM 181602=DAOM 197198]